jgi:thiamine biosynthesis lipoprotein
VQWLHRVDAVFSTFKAGSDISRIRRGELSVSRADPDVARVLALCDQIESETDGYFSARWDGRLDPTGLVKGWAVEEASRLLRRHGSANHAVNGGGDIQLAGAAGPDQPWAIGISDPRDRTRVLTTVTGCDFAIASSGTAERGPHIRDPRTGSPAVTLAGITVVGRSLTRVDAFATAAFVMGERALPWLDGLPGYQGLAVTADGIVAATPGFFRPAGPPPLLPVGASARAGGCAPQTTMATMTSPRPAAAGSPMGGASPRVSTPPSARASQ